MKRSSFLIVTAVLEVVTGLGLLAIPEELLKLLFGDGAPPIPIVFGRVFGAVLVLFGVGCWLVRNQHGSAGQYGFMLAGFLYDIAAAIALAYLGIAHGMVGLLLWPAVAAHTLLTGWGALCLREKTSGSLLPERTRGE